MGFVKAVKSVAFAKVGSLGPTGSGKTTLLAMIALYLSKEYHKSAPVAFLDSEKGSDFVQPFFEAEGVELFVNKSRNFTELRNSGAEAIKLGCCCNISDSMTHFWNELKQSLMEEKRVKRLDIGLIGQLKDTWAPFTESFISSQIHWLTSGRLGYEWEQADVEDEKGNVKKELVKGGTKMKTEGDFGYEPDLLVEMCTMEDPDAVDYQKVKGRSKTRKNLSAKMLHVATVKKSRVWALNGKVFSWPDADTYKAGDYKKVAQAFLPYFQFLNIGGEHKSFTAGNSRELFRDTDSRNEYFQQKVRREKAVEEIRGSLGCVFTASTGKDAAFKLEVINFIFGTHSWGEVESLPADTTELGARICRRLKELCVQTPPVDRNALLALAEQAKKEVREEVDGEKALNVNGHAQPVVGAMDQPEANELPF